jgi:hypothetical protein
VNNLKIALAHKEQSKVRTAAVGGGQNAADDNPAAMIDAATKRPFPGKPITAVNGDCFSGGLITGRAERLLGRTIFILNFFRIKPMLWSCEFVTE